MELLNHFQLKGIHFTSINEGIDTRTTTGKFLFHIMAAVSEMERNIISERTKNSLAAKKANNIKLGRPSASVKNIDDAIKMYKSKEWSLREIREKTGVAKPTLYKYLKARNEK